MQNNPAVSSQDAGWTNCPCREDRRPTNQETAVTTAADQTEDSKNPSNKHFAQPWPGKRMSAERASEHQHPIHPSPAQHGTSQQTGRFRDLLDLPPNLPNLVQACLGAPAPVPPWTASDRPRCPDSFVTRLAPQLIRRRICAVLGHGQPWIRISLAYWSMMTTCWRAGWVRSTWGRGPSPWNEKKSFIQRRKVRSIRAGGSIPTPHPFLHWGLLCWGGSNVGRCEFPATGLTGLIRCTAWA